MASRKKSNFKASQDQAEADRLKLINDALVELHGEKARFDGITALAVRVASMVTMMEKFKEGANHPGISDTTLTRKKKRDDSPNPFRLLLLAYQSGKFDPSSPGRKLTKKDVEQYIKQYPALNAYILQKDLEISNLKNDLADEKKHLKRLTDQFKSQGVEQIKGSANVTMAEDLKKARQDLSLTITWISRFLATQEWLRIDEENETIVNAANRNQPIADKHLLAPFFRAIKARKQEVADE